MDATRKITVEVPREILDRAKKSTGLDTRETVLAGLRLIVANQAYSDLRKMRGKVQFSLSYRQMKGI